MRRVRLTPALVALLLLVALVSRCSSQNAAPPSAAPSGASGAATAPASASPSAPLPSIAPGTMTRATVSRNVDGDTLHVRTDAGVTEKVRFIGVNTPESTIQHEPYGKESSDYTKRQLPVGTVVWLETDVGLRDRYGRLLAYVWTAPPRDGSAGEVRGKLFNARLLIEGYAQLMTIPPDVKYVDVFKPLQSEAREAGLGLWGLETP